MENLHNPQPSDSLEELRARLALFAAARDWDQFHSPKNLSMALIAEAAELVEHFQWLSESASQALAPAKDGTAIRRSMARLRVHIDDAKGAARESRGTGKAGAPRFAPGGQSTQMIVGADGSDEPESDGAARARIALSRSLLHRGSTIGHDPAL